jgi:hypothetical protein
MHIYETKIEGEVRIVCNKPSQQTTVLHISTASLLV